MHDYVKRITKMIPKLSQEQLQRIIKNVANENAMLDSILESLTTGLIVVDKQWRILKFNKISERFLSFIHFEDETNRSYKKVWEVISDVNVSEFLRDCADKDKSNISQEFSIPLPNSDNLTRFIVVYVLSLVSDSKINGRIIKIYDVTEQRLQEVKMRRMENMAGLTTLAANMAHEIKNPLGAISIHIQLLQKAIEKQRNSTGVLPEKKFVEEHLDVVNEEIDNLNRLITDFLFAVRPVNANYSLVDPYLILKKLVDFLSPEFNSHRVSFTVKNPNSAAKLLIDEKIFREMIINIVQNAFAAIKERFPECKNEDLQNDEFIGKISIRISVKFDKYIISISDNGCGMSDETIVRLFEPYFTTKASGTGLGMTLVYKIVKEFSGDIHVKSEENKGTTFIIEFPIPQTEKKLLSSDIK